MGVDEEIRIRDIEKRLNSVENEIVISKNDAGYAKERVTELSKKIDNLQTGINKLMWTAGGGVILAIGNFLVQGGFKVGGA